LKLLQEDVAVRTERLQQAAEEREKASPVAKDQGQSLPVEYERLGDEQSRLGDHAARLRPPSESEDDTLSLLTPISQRMHEAGGRIRQAGNMENALDLQQHVVADLDWLLREVEKSGGPSKSPGGKESTAAAAKQSKGTAAAGRSPSPIGPEGTAQKQRGGRSGEPSSGTSGNEPGDASTAKGDGRGRTGEQASRPDLNVMHGRMKQLWGELPQHVRERMLQSPMEELPPKYEQAIEEYFRRLSQEKAEE
jgi:hypothetical protein